MTTLLVMTPKPDTELGDSDHSISPHLTKLKNNKKELKSPIIVNGGDDISSSSSPGNGPPIPDVDQEEQVDNDKIEQIEMPSDAFTSCTSDGYIPAHLFEPQIDEQDNVDSGYHLQDSEGGQEETSCSVGDIQPTGPLHSDDTAAAADKDIEDTTLDAKDAQSCGDQSTPTNYNIHRRVPSSSIPHLLRTSNTLSVDATDLIRDQLSFVGIDAALSPTIRSRNESFAFSIDGVGGGDTDNNNNKSLVGTSAQIIMNLKQTAPSPLGLEGCLSSSSITSINCPSQKSIHSQLTPNKYNNNNGTPSSVHPGSFTSPPHKMPMYSTMQASEGSLNMPQLTQQLTVSPLQTSNIIETTTGVVSQQQTILSGIPSLPLPSQPLPPSYQGNRFPISSVSSSSGAQPGVALYSAINSLERYNAGSFDNKVMLAKARGGGSKQKAFPGVPQKTAESMLGGLETKESSVSARVDDEKQHEKSTSQNNKQTTETMEQIVPIRSEQSSQKRLYKSRSSGSLVELKAERKKDKKVTIKEQQQKSKSSRRGSRRREKKKTVGVFRPSSDAYTPRMNNRDLKYKPAEERECVEKISSTMGTIQRPNFRDALRRVAIILHQHIVKIEHRFSTGAHGADDTGLFKTSMREQFNEDNFATPRYKCSMVRVPMARPGVVYSMRKIRVVQNTPTTDEIYEFAHQLFKKVQLSSECSIVCLIYVEKLMEVAKVPLVAETWRPIFMCGLLLASKVWQDLSSWNIEFASVYPQFSLDAINRLELSFLKFIKWDLYISSSLYAKYYFALRSLLEKSGFRNRYNEMIGGIGGVAASEAMKVSKRSEALKEESLLQLSRSM